MNSLNIIGCGNVGRTLARLWHVHGVFRIQDVFNRTSSSANEAARFIGAGRVAEGLADMRPSAVCMLSVPDDRIRECAQRLVHAGLVGPARIVFHVSGARSSGELDPARKQGALTASVHPLTSFADPGKSVSAFSGTHCAADGDPGALEVLGPAFEAIGGRVVPIDSAAKTIYHAAGVTLSNHLVALIEVGLRTYAGADIDHSTALRICEPLVRGVIDNVFELGPAGALTGPVLRGDAGTVTAHLEALDAFDADTGALYRRLGRVALELARGRDTLSSEALRQLEAVLEVTGREPISVIR